MFLKTVSTAGFPDQPASDKDADRQVIEINITFEQAVKMIRPRFDCESIIIIFAASERF